MGKRKQAFCHTRAFWMFVLPALLLFSVFFILPLILSIGFSFTDYDGWKTMNFTGLQNYTKLLSSGEFYKTLGMVELNDQIQDAKAQLVSAQSQYTYYNSTLNSKTNITSVEEAASRLGLMKIDPSQITYIRLNESGALERQQSPVRQWTSFIYNGAVTILGTVK